MAPIITHTLVSPVPNLGPMVLFPASDHTELLDPTPGAPTLPTPDLTPVPTPDLSPVLTVLLLIMAQTQGQILALAPVAGPDLTVLVPDLAPVRGLCLVPAQARVPAPASIRVPSQFLMSPLPVMVQAPALVLAMALDLAPSQATSRGLTPCKRGNDEGGREDKGQL